MSLDPAIFRALVANGATPEMLLAVVEAEARVDEERKEKKRLGNAERQARFRAKQPRNDSNALRSVTERYPPNDISNPPVISNPETTNVVSPPKPKKPRTSKDGDPLSDDWQPILTEASQEIVGRWPPGWLEARLAEFRDHARDKGRRSKDWQAAFRKWLSNADEWTRQKNGRTSSNSSGDIDRRSAVAKVLDRDIARHYEPPDGQPVGGVGAGGSGPVAYLAAVR